MSGGGLRSVAWASVITLDSTSAITLNSLNGGRVAILETQPAPRHPAGTGRERVSYHIEGRARDATRTSAARTRSVCQVPTECTLVSQKSVGKMLVAGGIAALLLASTASSVHARDMLRRALEEAPAPSAGPCPQLLYGTGLHGAGEMNSVHAVESVNDCCEIALGALNGTWHCDGFTYQNDSRTCLLLREPLRPHTLNAENNTSGSWVQLPGPGPTPSPIPGPAPPFPTAPVPAAKPTMPSSPTFPKPPRPNIGEHESASRCTAVN